MDKWYESLRKWAGEAACPPWPQPTGPEWVQSTGQVDTTGSTGTLTPSSLTLQQLQEAQQHTAYAGYAQTGPATASQMGQWGAVGQGYDVAAEDKPVGTGDPVKDAVNEAVRRLKR